MIHIIDGQSDEIVGIIPDDEFWADNYHRSLETTAETLEFTTFADRDYSEYLNGRNKVIIPDEDNGFRELTIWQAAKEHEHSKNLVVFTKASYNDLRKAKVIKPQSLKSQQAGTVAGIVLDDTEWRVGIVESEGTRTFHIEKHTDPYAMLKCIATEFDLELDFRIEVSGNKITGRYVDLVQQIGQWRGREIEFGKDLLSIRRTEVTDNIYTALIGLGPEKDGKRKEVLVENFDALQRWGRPDPITGELRHIIGTYEPQSENEDMTDKRLYTLTENELEKRINEVIEYETEIADLEHVPGMENEKIRLGDTLKIKDTQFNPPLYVEARVFEVSGSIKKRGRKSVKLGDFTEYTEQEVMAVWQSLQEEIRRSIARMLNVNVVSSAGTVFKNGIGDTELTAVVYNQGNETDKNGETYEYTWTKYDKHGNLINDWSASGKKINVQATDIDEKAMYACEVVFQDVAVLGYVTLTNVFDGTQGIPGKPGEDGRTSYFHTAYANSADGNLDFSLTDFDGKLYIGTYTDFEPNDSTNPSDYKWARFKGEQGPRGLQGLQGPEGDQGIPGEPGEDGKSSYTHIAYADDKQGGGFSQDPTGKEYMGVYVDHQPQDSDNPNDYKWSLIKGQDGDDGIPGKPGEDGRTPYLHIAYADDAQGNGFSQSPDGKEYIGTYTDFTQADSDNPNDYTWQRTKGDKGDRGPQGVPGPKGKDGQTLYTWVKYADTPTSGMSDNPNGKEYIGLAYNKTSPNESSDYNDYQWTKAKGDKGAPGPKGDDGQTTYTWVKYADDKDGNGMSDDSEGKRYLGLAYNKTTPNESTNPSDYNWSPLYDNVQVGGRNYVISNKVLSHTPYNTQWIYDENTKTFTSTVKIVNQWTLKVDGFTPSEGETYTLSGYMYVDGEPIDDTIFRTDKYFNTYQTTKNITVNSTTGRFVATMLYDRKSDWLIHAYLSMYVPEGAKIELKELQFEDGNISTTYRPAPEDERAYAEYISQLKADLAEEEAKAHADGKVTEEERARIDQAKRNLAEAKQHANDKANEAENNAKGHADKVSKDKADQALRDAKAFSENASNIKEGIINVNSVPIRSSASGAEIDWDEINGIVQYDSKGNPVSQIDMKGNSRFTNTYIAGEVHANRGKLGNGNVLIDEDGVRIVRPDGAIAINNGLLPAGFDVSEYDPHAMEEGELSGSGAGRRFQAYYASLGFYQQFFGALDGRGTPSGDTNNVRDSNYGYTIRFQSYEFMHAARYLVFRYRIAYNGLVGKHRVRFYESGDPPSGYDSIYRDVIYDKGDRGLKEIIIDLGKPSYQIRKFQFRIGWNLSWNDKDEIVRFRIDGKYQTDYI